MNLYANLSMKLCELAALKLTGQEDNLRHVALTWTSQCIFRDINPAELADDAMQLIRVHSDRSVDSVVRIEAVIAGEVDAWNKRIQADVCTAIKAIESMRCWLAGGVKASRIKKTREWLKDSYGLQWWVSMDILSVDRRCVILAILETGLIDESYVNKLTKDLNFGKYGIITRHYAEKWHINDGSHWPADWRAAWEFGKMQRVSKLKRKNIKTIVAL